MIMSPEQVFELGHVKLDMSDLTLWCLAISDACVPVGDAFSVKVPQSDNIEDLKEKFYASEKGPTELKNWRAADLYLWKPTNDLALDAHLLETVSAWKLNRETYEEHNKRATYLQPFSIVQDEFSGSLPKRCVHVLVQLPVKFPGALCIYIVCHGLFVS
jgi:hypothetical protein